MERFAVIGLGRFGLRLATLLSQAGAEVIAVDSNADLIEKVRDEVALAVCLDATSEEALRSQGIDEVDVAVVGIGTDFESNVLATVTLKQLGVGRVISRATTTTRGQILSRVGADELVNPEEEAAHRWSTRLLTPAIMERIELAEGYSITKIAAPRKFLHKTLEDLHVRRKYGVNVVAIRRGTQEARNGQSVSRQQVLSAPMADTVIEPGDVLLLIGSDQAIAALPAD